MIFFSLLHLLAINPVTLFAAKSAMESRATFAKRFSSVYAKPLKRTLSARCESRLREKRFGIFFRSPNPKTIRRRMRWLGQAYHQRYHNRTPPPMIRILRPAYQNFRRRRGNSQSPRMFRQPWLAQNFREKDSRRPRMIRVSHLAKQTFWQQDNIPNS